MIYLLYGPDELMRSEALAALKASLPPDLADLNMATLDGRSVPRPSRGAKGAGRDRIYPTRSRQAGQQLVAPAGPPVSLIVRLSAPVHSRPRRPHSRPSSGSTPRSSCLVADRRSVRPNRKRQNLLCAGRPPGA